MLPHGEGLRDACISLPAVLGGCRFWILDRVFRSQPLCFSIGSICRCPWLWWPLPRHSQPSLAIINTLTSLSFYFPVFLCPSRPSLFFLGLFLYVFVPGSLFLPRTWLSVTVSPCHLFCTLIYQSPPHFMHHCMLCTELRDGDGKDGEVATYTVQSF